LKVPGLLASPASGAVGSPLVFDELNWVGDERTAVISDIVGVWEESFCVYTEQHWSKREQQLTSPAKQ
jgi:hypothetical protein